MSDKYGIASPQKPAPVVKPVEEFGDFMAKRTMLTSMSPSPPPIQHIPIYMASRTVMNSRNAVGGPTADVEVDEVRALKCVSTTV